MIQNVLRILKFEVKSSVYTLYKNISLPALVTFCGFHPDFVDEIKIKSSS